MQPIDTKNSLLRWSGDELHFCVKKGGGEGENVIFGTLGFGMQTTLPMRFNRLSRCKITRRTQWWRLQVLKWFRSWDIFIFLMYYAYVTSGASLLIGSTDPMILQNGHGSRYHTYTVATCLYCSYFNSPKHLLTKNFHVINFSSFKKLYFRLSWRNDNYHRIKRQIRYTNMTHNNYLNCRQ